MKNENYELFKCCLNFVLWEERHLIMNTAEDVVSFNIRLSFFQSVSVNIAFSDQTKWTYTTHIIPILHNSALWYETNLSQSPVSCAQ